MEQLEGVPREVSYHGKGNYARPSILDVIKEIEAGLPFQAVCTKYNLNKTSVMRWSADRGFRHAKPKRRNFSVQDKRSIVRSNRLFFSFLSRNQKMITGLYNNMYYSRVIVN